MWYIMWDSLGKDRVRRQEGLQTVGSAGTKGQACKSGKADSVAQKQVQKQTPVTGRVTRHQQE